jgi:hypothetical protein
VLQQLLGAEGVVHPLQRLLDDRTFVKVAGREVRRRADQLHAARVRLLVGPRALEAWQERMVDVDDAAPQAGWHRPSDSTCM